MATRATRAAAPDRAPGRAVPVVGRSRAVQADLRVSQPADPLEHEADRVADRVLRMSGPIVTRACTCDDDDNDVARVPASGARAVAVNGSITRDALGLPSAGRPLPDAVRRWAEPAFGADFSQVRVHDGDGAARSAQRIAARAYTLRNDIVFASRQYRPGSSDGRWLLAHELTHVVQQRRSGLASDATAARAAALLFRDFAVEPPHPDAVPRELTEEEIADAITFNNRSFFKAPEIELLRDIVGVAPAPAVFDADFIRAIALFQAMQGLTQDGKLGPTTASRLSRETRAEARALGRTEGRELRQETYRLNRRSMTMTVTTAAHELTTTGDAEYAVRWGVPDPTANGWIIQHITVTGNKENCAGVAQPLNNATPEFWEGWQVRAGRVFVGSSADAHVADTFRNVDEGAGTRGVVRATGRVTFIPDFDFREPPWGHTIPDAGALPTLTVAPPGWSDGFANLHELVVRWDDCVVPATHSLESTPR